MVLGMEHLYCGYKIQLNSKIYLAWWAFIVPLVVLPSDDVQCSVKRKFDFDDLKSISKPKIS